MVSRNSKNLTHALLSTDSRMETSLRTPLSVVLSPFWMRLIAIVSGIKTPAIQYFFVNVFKTNVVSVLGVVVPGCRGLAKITCAKEPIMKR